LTEVWLRVSAAPSGGARHACFRPLVRRPAPRVGLCKHWVRFEQSDKVSAIIESPWARH